MVKTRLWIKFLFLVSVIFSSDTSFAESYDYKTSEQIIMNGKIVHAGSSEKGSSHFFTVSYKGSLYFCQKTQNYTKCYD